MSVEEMVKRLRGVDHMSVEDCFLQSPLFGHAADKLEELDAHRRKVIAENERLLYALIEANRKLEELAAALRVAQGNTDAAIEDYNEAKAALAEKDKVLNRIEMWATDKSEKAWYRLEIIADEARNAGGKE